jgi:ferredoxin
MQKVTVDGLGGSAMRKMGASLEGAEPSIVSARDCTPDKNLTGEFRAYLLEKGADLVGFGPVERLRGGPEIQRPQRYLPDAVNLISIAMHINEAVCDLIARSVTSREAPPSYHSYQLFTLALVNPLLDELAFLAAKFLERRGYKAYPFPANLPHVLKPSAEYPGGPGDVSHRHIAVACGLGDLGWHSLLLTPHFGARQKLTSIATNAPLVPDPMLNQKLCDPEKCGFLCAKACPTAAIPRKIDAKVSVTVGDCPVEYGKLVGWRCRWGCSGMLKCGGGYKDIHLPKEEPSEESLLQYKGMVDPWQKRLSNLTGLLPYCGRCFSVCPLPGQAPGTQQF